MQNLTSSQDIHLLMFLFRPPVAGIFQIFVIGYSIHQHTLLILGDGIFDMRHSLLFDVWYGNKISVAYYDTSSSKLSHGV